MVHVQLVVLPQLSIWLLLPFGLILLWLITVYGVLAANGARVVVGVTRRLENFPVVSVSI